MVKIRRQFSYPVDVCRCVHNSISVVEVLLHRRAVYLDLFIAKEGHELLNRE